jgi:hypothetical protein
LGDSDLKFGDRNSDINLSPDDAGLSLEEPLNLGDSGINLKLSPGDSDIKLSAGDSGLSLEGDSLELPADDDVLKADDEFLLSPAGDYDDDDVSGSQVIALEDSEAFDADAADLLRSDSFGTEEVDLEDVADMSSRQPAPSAAPPAETSSGGSFFDRLFGRKKKP